MSVENILNIEGGFKNLPQLEKVKVAAYAVYLIKDTPNFTSKDLQNFFKEYHLDAPSNLPRELAKLNKERPKNILKTGHGYALERDYIQEMNNNYGALYSVDISKRMQDLLIKIEDINQKKFLEDALKCFSMKIYRASIIMTWLVVLDILYDYVLKNHLAEFNNEITKQNKKLIVQKKADFEDIKESIFIEFLRAASIISKEQKKILDDKLTIRNSAAHPNVTSFKEAKVVSFIEELLIDVIDKST